MAECFGKLNTVFACSVEAFLAHKTQMVYFNKASKSSIHSSLLKKTDAVRKKKEKKIPLKVVSEVIHIAFSVYWKEGIGQKL